MKRVKNFGKQKTKRKKEEKKKSEKKNYPKFQWIFKTTKSA